MHRFWESNSGFCIKLPFFFPLETNLEKHIQLIQPPFNVFSAVDEVSPTQSLDAWWFGPIAVTQRRHAALFWSISAKSQAVWSMRCWDHLGVGNHSPSVHQPSVSHHLTTMNHYINPLLLPFADMIFHSSFDDPTILLSVGTIDGLWGFCWSSSRQGQAAENTSWCSKSKYW